MTPLATIIYEGDRYGMTVLEGMAVSFAGCAGLAAAIWICWRLSDWWADRQAELADQPIADATDDPEATKDGPFVAKPPTAYQWMVSAGLTVHTVRCRHSRTASDWIGADTIADGAARAAELGFPPGRCCNPFTVEEATA